MLGKGEAWWSAVHAITRPLTRIACVALLDFAWICVHHSCFVGINSITSGPHPDNCSESPVYVTCYLVGLHRAAACTLPVVDAVSHMAWLPLHHHQLFNLNYNVLIILILKYGSSNILWLAMTVMVPMGKAGEPHTQCHTMSLTCPTSLSSSPFVPLSLCPLSGNLAFSLPFMPDRKSIHITDLIGLLGIMLGLMMYAPHTRLPTLQLCSAGPLSLTTTTTTNTTCWQLSLLDTFEEVDQSYAAHEVR